MRPSSAYSKRDRGGHRSSRYEGEEQGSLPRGRGIRGEQTLGASVPQSTFTFQERRGRIDLARLAAVDIERVVATRDIDALQDNLQNITFGRLTKDDLRCFSEEQFVKLFELAQLTIEYLINVQFTLSANEQEMRDHCDLMQMEVSKQQSKARREAERVAALKKEIRAKKHTLKAYEAVLMQAQGQQKIVGHRCHHCDKMFWTSQHRDAHEARDHGVGGGGRAAKGDSELASELRHQQELARVEAAAKQERLAALEADNKMLRQETREAIAAIAAAARGGGGDRGDDRVRQIEEDMRELRAQNRQLEAERRKQQEELLRARTIDPELQRRFDNLQREVDDRSRQVNELKEKLEEAMRLRGGWDAKISDDDGNGLTAEQLADLQAAKAAALAARDDVERERAERARLDAQLEAERADVRQLRDRVSTAEDNEATMASEVEELKRQMAALLAMQQDSSAAVDAARRAAEREAAARREAEEAALRAAEEADAERRRREEADAAAAEEAEAERRRRRAEEEEAEAERLRQLEEAERQASRAPEPALEPEPEPEPPVVLDSSDNTVLVGAKELKVFGKHFDDTCKVYLSVVGDSKTAQVPQPKDVEVEVETDERLTVHIPPLHASTAHQVLAVMVLNKAQRKAHRAAERAADAAAEAGEEPAEPALPKPVPVATVRERPQVKETPATVIRENDELITILGTAFRPLQTAMKPAAGAGVGAGAQAVGISAFEECRVQLFAEREAVGNHPKHHVKLQVRAVKVLRNKVEVKMAPVPHAAVETKAYAVVSTFGISSGQPVCIGHVKPPQVKSNASKQMRSLITRTMLGVMNRVLHNRHPRKAPVGQVQAPPMPRQPEPLQPLQPTPVKKKKRRGLHAAQAVVAGNRLRRGQKAQGSPNGKPDVVAGKVEDDESDGTDDDDDDTTPARRRRHRRRGSRSGAGDTQQLADELLAKVEEDRKRSWDKVNQRGDQLEHDDIDDEVADIRGVSSDDVRRGVRTPPRRKLHAADAGRDDGGDDDDLQLDDLSGGDISELDDDRSGAGGGAWGGRTPPAVRKADDIVARRQPELEDHRPRGVDTSRTPVGKRYHDDDEDDALLTPAAGTPTYVSSIDDSTEMSDRRGGGRSGARSGARRGTPARGTPATAHSGVPTVSTLDSTMELQSIEDDSTFGDSVGPMRPMTGDTASTLRPDTADSMNSKPRHNNTRRSYDSTGGVSAFDGSVVTEYDEVSEDMGSTGPRQGW